VALPDFTTQDNTTYKTNIDSTASDHNNRLDGSVLSGSFSGRQGSTFTFDDHFNLDQLIATSGWVTLTGAALTELQRVGAKVAHLKIIMTAEEFSGIESAGTLYLSSVGGATALSIDNIASKAASSATLNEVRVNVTTASIMLNSSQEFFYSYVESGGSANVVIYLTGYDI